MGYFLTGKHLSEKKVNLGINEHFATLFTNTRYVSTNREDLSEILKELKYSFEKLSKRFQGVSQHDAHEFMRLLVDVLHTELNQGELANNKESSYFTYDDNEDLSLIVIFLFMF